jgi:beta-glucosidase
MLIKSFCFRQVLVCFGASIALGTAAQNNFPQLGKSPTAEVVQAMTLEEKAALVVGTGLRFEGKGPVVGEADGRVPGASGNTMDISRLGIPGTVLADGPAGVRIDEYRGKDSTKTFFATAWPVGTLLASSWDTALVKEVGVAFGNEIKEYGIDVILAPGMNIQRDPLNGRNFEYYSEDPVVSGNIASAMVNGIQSNGVGVSIKHFAANNQETNRNSVNVILSERALREIYLKGFEIAVKKAKPWTVMSSYNKINGVYTSENNELLTKILRDEWKFKGMVMTDWYGGKDRAAQMKAGNDLIMPGSKKHSEAIVEAVKNGTLDMKVLDLNAERVLNFILKTPSYQKFAYSDHPDLRAHALLARKAAAEGMVVLKNEKVTLPLRKQIKLALFGNASYQTIIGGTGSGQVNTSYMVPIAEGLSNEGYIISEDLKTGYLSHIQKDKLAHPKKSKITIGAPRVIPERDLSGEAIIKTANESGAAIYTIGRNAGEGADRKVAGDFNLTDTEKIIIKNIADAFHAKGKKLIVLLNIGGPIETASWRDDADAILLVWQPGLEAGNAVADVLSGAVNPSGKLTATFPMKYEDEPSSKDFPGIPVNMPKEVVYEEGIYVGYRYFNSFSVKPAYPFGFGLSYTDFTYSNLKLSSSIFAGSIKATVTITNNGKLPGREIVQLYLHSPVVKMEKPLEELKGFAKTTLLKPGDSQSISFTLTAKDLASFNTEQSSWIADAGQYMIKIGASSEDIKLTKPFTLAKQIVAEKCSKQLTPQVVINELKK